MGRTMLRGYKKSLGLVSVFALLACGQVSAQSKTSPTLITDLSWPNCEIRSVQNNELGIVGVTGGLSFRASPCVAQETRLFKNYGLYMNSGYPGLVKAAKFQSTPLSCEAMDESCISYNYGYNAALYAIHYASLQGAHSNIWWIDVETENSWSENSSYNVSTLRGMVDAIKHSMILNAVGFYSNSRQWKIITGDWKNHLPSWVATGNNSYDLATTYCRANDFTSGGTWLSQYVNIVDKDYPCNTNIFKTKNN